MSCKYEDFFTEVFRLEAPSNAPTTQHEIYYNEIHKFIKKNPILTPSQVIERLPKDCKITQLDLKTMEEELKLFSVTYFTEESNIAYPAFQFDFHAGIIEPKMRSILKSLNGMYSNWDVAFWLNSFSYDLDGSIIETFKNTA